MSDALGLILRLNLAAAAAILVVTMVRAPARRLFGPRIAYGLWSFVPLALAAALVPARVATLAAPPSPDIEQFGLGHGPAPLVAPLPAAAPLAHVGPGHLALAIAGIWLAGLLAGLAILLRSQARFDRAARAGRAGPAVVGVLSPRIVTPDDFAALYTPAEQRAVMAHEAAHIARQDPRLNAAVALVRCLAWFNPLVHLMAHGIRIDQEFACDAAVIARFPRARRAYARALLKAGLAARPLPFGCYWATHPLVARVDLLSRPRGDAMSRGLGIVAVAVLALGGAAGVWAARPARIVLAPSHETVILARAVREAPPLPDRTAPALARQAPAPAAVPVERLLTPQPAMVHIPLTEAPAAPVLEPASLRQHLDPGLPPYPPETVRRVRGAAKLSSVAPGNAVRVLATMIDPEGRKLTTDLTAFGSQSLYRVGYVERNGSRLKLFTSVVQDGDRYLVTAALNASFRPIVSGSVEVRSGEGGVIRLPGGLEVDVHLLARPETPEEVAAASALGPRAFVNVEQLPSRL